MNIQSQPTIALLHWGNVIEDFLDSIEISFEEFCHKMTGGWMFGYIDALKLVGVRTVLFCISKNISTPAKLTHQPTGATIWVLPAPSIYLAIHYRMVNPYGWTVKETFGESGSTPHFLLTLLRDLAPYLATPLKLLVRELRAESCQAILCQEYEYARFDMSVLLGQLTSLPVFATFQGGNFQISRFEHFIRPLTLRACAGLIIPSQKEAERVQSSYGVPAHKIAHIFNPLDLSLWEGGDRLQTRADLGISPQAQVVVWHGRIDLYRKGLDILTAAWERIYRDRPERELRLLLIGTGSDAEQLRQQLTAMQLQGVIWIDRYILDRTAIRNYLVAADVYTLPSRHEGFPVAPLEAMACRLPVVATNVPGIPEILEGEERSGGLIVPCENPTALALALGRVLDNDILRQALSQRARHRVETYFSLEGVGKQLYNLLLKFRGS